MSERTSSNDKKVIFDVGVHQGEDTDYYLKKGFSVVGFEANPALIQHCKEKFAKEITSGRFVLIEGAIVDCKAGESPRETIPFYRNMDDTVWGTVCDNWAERNEKLGTRNEIIEVPTINFSDCLQEYGIPYYMKVDIEGMDRVCLEALLEFAKKPSYLSVESEKVSHEKLIEEFHLLEQLGYNAFKAVQQSGISKQKEPDPVMEGCQTAYPFTEGSSGLFGRDLPGSWKNSEEIRSAYKKIFFLYEYFGDFGKWRRKFYGRVIREVMSTILRKPIPGWYDTHARHESVNPL